MLSTKLSQAIKSTRGSLGSVICVVGPYGSGKYHQVSEFFDKPTPSGVVPAYECIRLTGTSIKNLLALQLKPYHGFYKNQSNTKVFLIKSPGDDYEMTPAHVVNFAKLMTLKDLPTKSGQNLIEKYIVVITLHDVHSRAWKDLKSFSTVVYVNKPSISYVTPLFPGMSRGDLQRLYAATEGNIHQMREFQRIGIIPEVGQKNDMFFGSDYETVGFSLGVTLGFDAQKKSGSMTLVDRLSVFSRVSCPTAGDFVSTNAIAILGKAASRKDIPVEQMRMDICAQVMESISYGDYLASSEARVLGYSSSQYQNVFTLIKPSWLLRKECGEPKIKKLEFPPTRKSSRATLKGCDLRELISGAALCSSFDELSGTGNVNKPTQRSGIPRGVATMFGSASGSWFELLAGTGLTLGHLYFIAMTHIRKLLDFRAKKGNQEKFSAECLALQNLLAAYYEPQIGGRIRVDKCVEIILRSLPVFPKLECKDVPGFIKAIANEILKSPATAPICLTTLAASRTPVKKTSTATKKKAVISQGIEQRQYFGITGKRAEPPPSGSGAKPRPSKRTKKT